MTGRRPWVLLLAVLVLCAGAGPAQAAGYRYWSFWDRDGDRWAYATQGPATARPSDGDVQGFRFAVSENSGDAARPRGEARFAAICAATPEREGRKRVALVIDFGTRTDAPSADTPPPPRTACASVSPDATTADALAAVAKPLRYDANALLCAIGGYPRTGCGEQVSDTTAGKRQPATDSGPSLGLAAGGAAVALLAAAAVWQARRRRHV
ncbi:SCO2322 family protein [Streptomyces sp. DH24]|uniref:SCO2322 family protein n=1 Tax=Streptomyces sp. DH24 TaxID=3040123 RepID=UPI00244351BB|nr:SCO2322 family protein [Streptomyces sp. DH24]MDG9716015.1 SCO2322 family protein [Streptomyces sp. DH24]